MRGKEERAIYGGGIGGKMGEGGGGWGPRKDEKGRGFEGRREGVSGMRVEVVWCGKRGGAVVGGGMGMDGGVNEGWEGQGPGPGPHSPPFFHLLSPSLYIYVRTYVYVYTYTLGCYSLEPPLPPDLTQLPFEHVLFSLDSAANCLMDPSAGAARRRPPDRRNELGGDT